MVHGNDHTGAGGVGPLDASSPGGPCLDSVETPCLVLDRTRLNVNIARMRTRASQLGVTLRPHLKSAKSVDVARLAVCALNGRIAVSTLKEADYFANAGYRDILYAVGITANKVAHAAALRRRGVELSL